MNSFTRDFRNWLSQPFSVDMPASHWFLFIGLLGVIVILWSLITRHITEVIKNA